MYSVYGTQKQLRYIENYASWSVPCWICVVVFNTIVCIFIFKDPFPDPQLHPLISSKELRFLL